MQLLARDSATGRRIAAVARYTTAADGEQTVEIAGTGRVSWREVPAAALLPLTVNAPGYRAAATEIDVHPDRALPVTFWLDPEVTPPELRADAVRALIRPGHALLHGHVVDVTAGRAVAGARVRARNASIVTETDARGYFTLLVPARAVAEGELSATEDLDIEAAGYKSYVIQRTSVAAGHDTHFIVDLEPGVGTTTRDDLHQVLAHALGEHTERVPPASPAHEGTAPDDLATRQPGGPIAEALPSTVPVPTNVKVGTGCSCTSCSGVSVYSREQYVMNGLNDEWFASWSAESLKAGAVAFRSYGSYYVLVGRISTSYDICSSTCCQVMDTDTSTSTNSAVSNTSGQILSSDSRQASRSEYAAETNDQGTCPDGYTGDGSGWPCISDSVCRGSAANGHGRGMCQWGSQRWASSQGRTHTWILDHYYNNNGAPSGSRNVFRVPGSTACLGAANDTNCNNFDPVGSGCGFDASTPTGAKVAITNSAGSTLGWIELRWSSACGSNWARVTSNIGTTTMTATVKRDDGVSFTDTRSGTNIWSTIVYSPVRKAQACGTISGVTKCTTWF